MSSTTARISEASRNALREIAAQTGESMQAILDKAIEDYRRRVFLEEVNKAYAALRQNPGAWAEVEQERAEWDATLADELPSDEQWTEKRTVIRKGARKAKRG